MVESCAAALDRHFPFALVGLRAEGIVDLRRVEHRRIEDARAARGCRVPAACSEPFVASISSATRARLGFEPPHRAARQHDIIAVAIGQMAEIAEQIALALMDEEQLVAVGIARQRGHRLVAASRCASADAHSKAAQAPCDARPLQLGSLSPHRRRAAAAARRTTSSPSADGCDRDASPGRKSLRGRSRAHRCPPADRHAPAARPRLRRAEIRSSSSHVAHAFSTPRLIWSASMDSNSAWKLPSPKPSIAFALDDLEEDRADGVLREDLQQQALIFRRRAVHQDAVALQPRRHPRHGP